MGKQTELIDQNLLIKSNFDLPNNDEELWKTADYLEKIKFRLEKKIINSEQINDELFITMYEEIIRGLIYVGSLSLPAFSIRDELKNTYTLKFINSPELGKKLWLDHYEKIHHPYNLLKNRSYKLLNDLDNYYMKKYRRKPPNWKK